MTRPQALINENFFGPKRDRRVKVTEKGRHPLSIIIVNYWFTWIFLKRLKNPTFLANFAPQKLSIRQNFEDIDRARLEYTSGCIHLLSPTMSKNIPDEESDSVCVVRDKLDLHNPTEVRCFQLRSGKIRSRRKSERYSPRILCFMCSNY
jgi:hypothetical protein